MARWICASEVEEFCFLSLVGLLPAMDGERKEVFTVIIRAEHRRETLDF